MLDGQRFHLTGLSCRVNALVKLLEENEKIENWS